MNVPGTAAPEARRRRNTLGRISPTRLLLLSVSAGSAVLSLLWTLLTGFVEPRAALSFGALIAAGELARITLPGRREVAPIASAGALGYTFLLSVGGVAVSLPAWQVIAVVALGLAVGELPHMSVGRMPLWNDLARRLLLVLMVALPFRLLLHQLPHLAGNWWGVLCVMVGLVLAAWLLDSVVAATIRAEEWRTRLGVALVDELRAQLAVGTAIGAIGILIALASAVAGLYSLLLFTAPLLVTQVAFRRYADIRRTYVQTVRSLSRVTEVGGYVETGHSRRVSRLAWAIGCELAMRESRLLELEYAALMHDIGQLSLREPISSGATVLISRREQRRIAELGAAIIQETGVLDGVAEIVRRQCEPCEGEEGESEGPPPLGSRVIKVANAYDDLVGDTADRDRVATAVQLLRDDSGCEYDADVVEAAVRVLEHWGAVR